MNNHPIIKLPVTELKNNLIGLGKVVPRHSNLAVLTTIHVERDRTGWIFLTASNLDAFATYRLEAPGQHGEPTKCLVPYVELQKLAKMCPADETIELEPVSEDKIILRHHIGTRPVEQVFTCEPVKEFPVVPEFNAASATLDEVSKATLLQAMQCASEDETRVILNGVYLDVSKPESHYIVATDGRHLFSSNSVRLPLATSLIVPDSSFLCWGGFTKDGQWKLAVKVAKKDEHPYLKLESRRWTFVTKQIDGNYPNWRQTVVSDEQKKSGTIEISDKAAEEIQRIIPRLPGDALLNHTLGLYTVSGRLWLRGWNEKDEQATEVEVPGVKVVGNPATVYINRHYLLKALGFGLRHIQVQEPLQPIRIHDGGSRQMIVMPIRVEAYPSGRKVEVTAAEPAVAIPIPVTVTQPQETTNPQEERNQTPMQQNTASNNGNGHQLGAIEATIVEKSPVEQALDQIETMKGNIRGVVTNLNALADTLRQVQRDRRSSEREIRSVRETLKTLQTVRL